MSTEHWKVSTDSSSNILIFSRKNQSHCPSDRFLEEYLLEIRAYGITTWEKSQGEVNNVFHPCCHIITRRAQKRVTTTLGVYPVPSSGRRIFQRQVYGLWNVAVANNNLWRLPQRERNRDRATTLVNGSNGSGNPELQTPLLVQKVLTSRISKHCYALLLPFLFSSSLANEPLLPKDLIEGSSNASYPYSGYLQLNGWSNWNRSMVVKSDAIGTLVSCWAVEWNGDVPFVPCLFWRHFVSPSTCKSHRTVLSFRPMIESQWPESEHAITIT